MNSPMNFIDPNGMIPWSWQRNGETAVQYSMRMYNQGMYDAMYLGGVGIGGGGAMDKTKLSYLVQTGYIGTKYELYDYYIDYYSEPNGQGEKGGTRYLGSIWEPTNQGQASGYIDADLSKVDAIQMDAYFELMLGKLDRLKVAGVGLERGFGVRYKLIGAQINEKLEVKNMSLQSPELYFTLGNYLGGISASLDLYDGSFNYNFKFGPVEFSKDRVADIVLWDVAWIHGGGFSSKGVVNLFDAYIANSKTQIQFRENMGYMMPRLP